MSKIPEIFGIPIKRKIFDLYSQEDHVIPFFWKKCGNLEKIVNKFYNSKSLNEEEFNFLKWYVLQFIKHYEPYSESKSFFDTTCESVKFMSQSQLYNFIASLIQAKGIDPFN